MSLGGALTPRRRSRAAPLRRILVQLLPEPVHEQLARPWSKVARSAALVLRHKSLALPARRRPPKLDELVETIGFYEAAVAEVRQSGATRELPNEAAERVFADGRDQAGAPAPSLSFPAVHVRDRAHAR